MRGPPVRHVILGAAVVIGATHIVGSLRSGDLSGNGDSWALGLAVVGHAALGWSILGRRAGVRMGWLLLLAGALSSVTFLASWWSQESLVNAPDSLPFGAFAAWWSTWSAPLPLVAANAAPVLLFPDGAPRSRRWRVFSAVVGVPFAALVAGSAALAAPVAVRAPVELNDGVAVRSREAELAIGLSAMAWVLAFAVAWVAFGGILVARRRAVGEERRQFSTVLVGVGAVLMTMVAGSLVAVLSDDRVALPEAVGTLFWLAVPTAVAVAIVRYRLYDLQVLVSRTVLVVGTGALLTGAYLGVVLLVARIAGTTVHVDAANVVAAAVVGLSSVFAAIAISAKARRWFGRSTGVHVVAERFDDGHRADDDAADTLHRLVLTVKDELHLGSVTLLVDGVDPVGVGDPDGPTSSVDLHHGGRSTGQLVVTARRGEALSGRDRELLEQIGRHVALTVDAVRANNELLAAQRALLHAHADERRRLRMDLHDGLGPALAAIRLGLMASTRRAHDPEVITGLADQTSDAIRELRRIVDGLQPSILEDLGLVAAVQILVADSARTTGIDFTVDAPADLDQLPTAVAATAYRAIAEGVANVTRHSGAAMCTVSIAVQVDHLVATIADDGVGFDVAARRGGVGLQSITARTRALGGDADVDSASGRGTTVSARIPIASST